jgi:hypothetical protein
MNHIAGVDRRVIIERNEGIWREVQRLRLGSQLRKYGGLRPGSRLASLISRSTLPLLRRARIAD